MNNRYFRLLDVQGLATEDDTSLALAQLVEGNVDIRRLFLRFLFGETPDNILAAAEGLSVKPQHSFSGSSADVQSLGRIDLALFPPGNRSIIGVEFKVRDREKPGRLKNYRIVMDHSFAGPNWLFEVVQQREHAIDTGIVDRVRTWNELHEFLSGNLNDVRHVPSRSALNEYLEFLRVSKTILPVGFGLRRRPRSYAGVPDETVCRNLFRDLAGCLPTGIISSIDS